MDISFFESISLEQLLQRPIGKAIEEWVKTFLRVQESLYNQKDIDKTTGLKAGTVLILEIINRFLQGKSPKEYTSEDWRDIVENILDKAVTVDGETYSKMVFLTYAKYINVSVELMGDNVSEDVIYQIKCLSEEILCKTQLLENKELPETEYVEACLWISLEAMTKLMAAWVGKYTIAEVAHFIDGGVSFAFEYSRLMLYRRENALLEKYIENQRILDEELQAQYEEYLKDLQEQYELFNDLIMHAFSNDFRESLKGSVELAKATGVKKEEVLIEISDIDNFFLD